jgi:hypothetical protein
VSVFVSVCVSSVAFTVSLVGLLPHLLNGIFVVQGGLVRALGGALNCVKLELSCTTNNTYGDVVVLHLFA